MFTSKLALLVLLTWGATTAYAYPTAEHMLPSPVPSAVTNTAERDPNANAARQIHNADYHANAPPPSPNPASTQDAPANAPAPPAPAQSAPPAAPKAKRLDKSFGPGPVVPPCPSAAHTSKDEVAVKPPTAITHMRSNKRFLGDALEHPAAPVAANANSYGNGNSNPNLALAARTPPTNNDLYGLHRRAVEELTNVSNRHFDHNAVVRWSKDEVDRMQAYSRAT